MTEENYEDLLKELADKLLNEEYLREQNKIEKVETIYQCNGKFKFVEQYEEEYDDDYYDEDEEEYDDDYYDEDEEDD